MYGNVQQSLKNNLNEFVNNPEKLEKDITEWINNGDIVYRFSVGFLRAISSIKSFLK